MFKGFMGRQWGKAVANVAEEEPLGEHTFPQSQEYLQAKYKNARVEPYRRPEPEPPLPSRPMPEHDEFNTLTYTGGRPAKWF